MKVPPWHLSGVACIWQLQGGTKNGQMVTAFGMREVSYLYGVPHYSAQAAGFWPAHARRPGLIGEEYLKKNYESEKKK